MGGSHGLHRGAATYPSSFKSLLQNSLHHGKHPAALHRLLTTPSTAFPGLSLPVSTLPALSLLAEGPQGAQKALLAQFLTPSPPRRLSSASPTDVAAQRAHSESRAEADVPWGCHPCCPHRHHLPEQGNHRLTPQLWFYQSNTP